MQCIANEGAYRADGLDRGEVGIAAVAEEPDVLVQRIVSGELARPRGSMIAQAAARASAAKAIRPGGVACGEAADQATEGNGGRALRAPLLHHGFCHLVCHVLFGSELVVEGGTGFHQKVVKDSLSRIRDRLNGWLDRSCLRGFFKFCPKVLDAGW